MKSQEWCYNELLQVGVDYANSKEVEKYDARMQKLRNIKKEIELLVEATAPSAEAAILEIGTGTGEFAIALSKFCKKVCAIDVSPVMLEYARAKAASRKIGNIEFRHAGFLSYEPAGEQYDIIFTQLALHHLPDFWKSVALTNVYGLLKKGGKFFLKDVVFPSAVKNYETFFNGVIESIENSAGAEFTKEIKEHIKKEYSTLDWIMENLLIKSGFDILQKNVENGFIASYLCSK
jgi:putative AdoMet-dependent methyltransferase